MSYNGSGIFSRLYSWAADAAGSIAISSSRMDAEMDGMATGLSTCITKDGQQTTTAAIPFAANVTLNDGSAGVPSYTFTADTNTGIYRIGSDNIGIAVNGAKVLDIATGGLSVTGAFNAADGLAATPSITFGSDTDTGFFSKSANVIGIAVGGAEVGTITAAGLTGLVATVATSGKYDDLIAGFKFGETFKYGTTISASGWSAASKITEQYAVGWDIVSTGHFGHIGFSGDGFYIGIAPNRSLNGTGTTSYIFQLSGGAGFVYGNTIVHSGNIGSQSVSTAAALSGMSSTPGGSIGSVLLTPGGNPNASGFAGSWVSVDPISGSTVTWQRYA